jgi:hypothetical protein
MWEGSCGGCRRVTRLANAQCLDCLVEGCRTSCQHLEDEFDAALGTIEEHVGELRAVVQRKYEEKDGWIEKYTKWYQEYEKDIV